MELDKVSKLDRKTREQAKILYLSDYEMLDICDKLNIDMPTLRFYIFGEDGRGSNEKCWFHIKKSINSVTVSAYIRDKISILDKTAGIALDILHNNLQRTASKLATDDEFVLSVDDMKKLAGIVVDMDKMVRLESGKPTDIVDEIKTMTVADARRILLEDPFAPEVVEAEIIEIPEIEKDKDIDAIGKPWK